MQHNRNLAALAWCGLLAAFLPSGWVHADVKLPQVISDHMVLQRDAPVPIFGTAAPGESVTVRFRDKSAAGTADAQGRWQVKVNSGESGGPFELTVKGANTILVKDVLVGEVWLASGQSNMSLPLSRTRDATNVIARADHPQIRCFRKATGWVVCSPKAAGKYTFSAMPYYFAVELQSQLHAPVGIVDTSVAGAIAQTFIRREALAKDPALAKTRDQACSSNYEELLAPVIPYAIRGALWCQGEGDRDYPATYRRLLPAVIADWRALWGRGDFPFLIVQLSNAWKRNPEPADNSDSVIREIQLQTAQTVTNTALVVTIDLNDAEDVHYPNKAPAGQRLALAARALAYGEAIESSGPIFLKAEFKDGKAVVSFTHMTGGLVAKGGQLAGFQLCGSDKRFVRAEAAIAGSTVVVSSSQVPDPVAVRYAWERNPVCNLCNQSDLPASPFRSDAFESHFTHDDHPQP
jgi:sialate O-acetylesterase